MKKIKITAFLLSLMMLSGCGGSGAGDVTTDADDIADIEEEFVEDEEVEEEEELEYDYDLTVATEEITKANAKAEEFSKKMSAFLAEAKAGGYGMADGAEGTYITAYVEDGLWMINIDDTDCFTYVEDELEWWGYSEADETTIKDEAEDNDTLLAIYLRDAFPNVTVGSMGAWVENNECKAAYFTATTTTGDYQVEELFGKGGWTANTCEWDGYNQGVSEEGNFVGTYPVLGIG